MQLEQTFGCPWIMGFVGNWTELWISKFSPYRFESIAPPLRNVGVEVARHCLRQGTRVAFDAMVSAFPPVLSPRHVTIVTKFFCTDTEPQHGPHIFGSGWHRVLIWDRSSGTMPTRRSHHGQQDDRRAHHRAGFAVARDKFSAVAPPDERY